jgi:hypothetical protein
MKQIPLTLGFTATADDKDYHRLKDLKWFVLKAKHTQHAVWYRTSKDKVLMHRENPWA